MTLKRFHGPALCRGCGTQIDSGVLFEILGGPSDGLFCLQCERCTTHTDLRNFLSSRLNEKVRRRDSTP